jgi:predicted AlkP superfamily pyrophosphatase or phosphodiesterase
MKNFSSILFLVLMMSSSFLAKNSLAQIPAPKLVVGIMVDQMRYDYLVRYHELYSNDGFKRLMEQGFVCRNAHYNYAATETGPGHASVYTGTTPSLHGIVGNDWFENGKDQYCAGDSTVSTVGSNSGDGAMSPRNMFTTTIGDEMKLASNSRSKVFGVSIKDRGAILPAGHSADAAFWYDYVSGKFITSTYYMEKLPNWLEKFNKQGYSDQYIKETWSPLLPIEKYTASQADDNNYEQVLSGKEKATFPYNLSEMKANADKSQMKRPFYGTLVATPFGNTLVRQMAEEILKNEELGKDNITDLLAVSFSSPDLAGHAFGPQSVEVEDIYLRLDLEIAQLLNTLDAQVGKGNYVVFLTADHAAAQVPRYSQDLKLPGGYSNDKEVGKAFKEYLTQTFGEGEWIAEQGSRDIYFDHDLIESKGLELEDFQRKTIQFFRKLDWVYEVYSAEEMQEQEYTQGIRHLIQQAYYSGRSADVMIVSKPGYLTESWKRGGTSHGSPFRYDTHVPILLYGYQIPKGNTVREVSITDVIPTISMILNLQLPSGCTGQPIIEVFR